MKLKRSRVLWIGIMSLAVAIYITAFPTSPKSQNPKWKGKIETVDGVKVIRNPNAPLFGDIKLDLNEDLKIGRPDDENYLLDRVRDVEVDEEGSIYVADMRNFRIQKFDKNGKYVLTFGRKGQGPGEFSQPTASRIDPVTKNVAVRDQVIMIKYFEPDGTFLKSLRLPNVLIRFKIAPNGAVFGVLGKSVPQSVHMLCRIGNEGQIQNTIAEGPYNVYTQSMSAGGTVSVTTGHELSLFFDILLGRSLVFGYPREYELNVADFDGKILFRIAKDEQAPKFTSKEAAEFKKIPLPERKPYFYGIFVDDVGRIYVQRNQADWGVKEDIDKELDVFSSDGYFLYRTKLPKGTYVIRGGYVYTCEVGEEEIVKRYRIKNWASFKANADD